MAISVLQRKTAADSSGAAGSVSLVLGSNTTAGSAIVICVVGGDSSAVLFNKEFRPPTDTQGNAYYYLFSNNWYSGAGYGMRWYAAYNVTAAANTITVPDSSNDAQAVAYEVAGLAPYAAFDKATFTNHASGGGTTFTSGATATTTFNNEIALGGFMVTNGVTTFTAGGSYTNIQNISGGSRTATEELIVSSTGAQTATATASADGFGIGSVITLADTPVFSNNAKVSVLGSTWDTNSGTHTVVATPAVGDLIVIVRAATGNITSTAPTDNNSSGTYVLAETALKNTSADLLEIWVRTALVPAASSTTFTEAPGVTTGGGLTVYKVTGMSKTGAAAIFQHAKQANQALNTAPAPAFTNNITSPNPVIGAVFNATNTAIAANVHPPIGFVQGNITGYGTPTAGIETIYNSGGSSGKTITWDAQSPSAFSSAVIELDSSLPPAKLFGTSSVPIAVDLQAVNRSNSF